MLSCWQGVRSEMLLCVTVKVVDSRGILWFNLRELLGCVCWSGTALPWNELQWWECMFQWLGVVPACQQTGRNIPWHQSILEPFTVKVILNLQTSLQPACSEFQSSCPLFIFDEATYPWVKPGALTLPILLEHLLRGTLHQHCTSTSGATGPLSHLGLTTPGWRWMGVSPSAQVNCNGPPLPWCC